MPTGRSIAEVLRDSTWGGLRMSNRAGRNGKALSLLIVWSLALVGIFAAIVALSPATRAGACDQIGVSITGDWTITTPQVCSGVLYTVDGSITINSGGSLTLINGGLKFSKDATHAGYSLNVNAGGALILDNSIVTTNPTLINPYLKLALTVSGAGSQLAMSNGAKLKFPGWSNATRASPTLTDSTLTSLPNVTIDRTQDPIYSSNWTAAFRPTAVGGSVNLFRWLDATVLDRTSFAVSGTAIWSSSSPTGATAQYPDNGPSTVPSARTLWFLGRAASGPNAWNRTDSTGHARVPLYTDQITSATLPNGPSFGNFQVVLTYSTSTVTDGVSFNAYPAVSAADNTHWATYDVANVQVRTGPDLEVRQADYTATQNVIQSQPFVVYAKIYNRGQTDASGVSIAAYLNGNRASQLGRVDGLSIVTGGPVTQPLNLAGLTQPGAQTLMLVADPDNRINEGGSAQENNNFANITLNVAPPPKGYVAISTPAPSQSVEPGKEVVVTGYVRATGTDAAIVGISMTIELSSGTAVIATNQSISGDQGLFVGTLVVPADTQDGSYNVVVTPTAGPITPSNEALAIKKNVPFLYQTVPMLGLPYWPFLLLLAAAAAAVIGVTLYWKVYGLGKLVEYGEGT